MDKQRPKIAFIGFNISPIQGKTQFQRAYYLSTRYEVYFFLRFGLCDDVARQAQFVRFCPGRSLNIDAFIFPFWAIASVLWLSRKEKLRLVYSTYQVPCLIAGFLLQRLGLHWVADIWDDPGLSSEIFSGSEGFVGKLRYYHHSLWYIVVKRVLGYADSIILALAPEFLSSYDVNREKVLYVTNGVDLGNLNCVVAENRQRRLAENSEFVITYVGHVKRIRGIDTVIAMAEHLKGKMHFKVMLIGPLGDEDERWLRQTVMIKQLQDSVSWTGAIDHQEALITIAQSDICLFPFPRKRELNYIYPIKVFEYMAMGKVVVASRLTGVSRIIRDRVNGLLVEPEDPQDMANAILEVYRNQKLKEQIEKQARESVEQYEWSRINSLVGAQLDKLLTN